MSVHDYMMTLGAQAKGASRALARTTTAQKNNALLAIADALSASRVEIKSANAVDLKKGKSNGLDEAMLDRLELNDARIDGMIQGLKEVVALPDPVGQMFDMAYRPSGIQVGKMRVPLGVIGIIYESRPNVTIDAASLCLKAGNACILRGGSESIESNRAIAACIKTGLEKAGLPAESVQVVDTTDREAVGVLIQMSEFVDVIIPRGGKGLIERISKDATINVIKHLDGICHVYLDEDADAEKAQAIAFNAKTHRYGVCNAMETLLIHESRLNELLPQLVAAYEEEGVELAGCENTLKAAPKGAMRLATDEDWDTEYLAPVLSIRTVDSMEQAIDHINEHGSHHTDSIVTENYTKARVFLTEVDSSSVMINASTRFADGSEYGLGAEIGISTDKFHARGPVGLEGLTCVKWVVFGDGHIRG